MTFSIKTHTFAAVAALALGFAPMAHAQLGTGGAVTGTVSAGAGSVSAGAADETMTVTAASDALSTAGTSVGEITGELRAKGYTIIDSRVAGPGTITVRASNGTQLREMTVNRRTFAVESDVYATINPVNNDAAGSTRATGTATASMESAKSEADTAMSNMAQGDMLTTSGTSVEEITAELVSKGCQTHTARAPSEGEIMLRCDTGTMMREVTVDRETNLILSDKFLTVYSSEEYPKRLRESGTVKN